MDRAAVDVALGKSLCVFDEGLDKWEDHIAPAGSSCTNLGTAYVVADNWIDTGSTFSVAASLGRSRHGAGDLYCRRVRRELEPADQTVRSPAHGLTGQGIVPVDIGHFGVGSTLGRISPVRHAGRCLRGTIHWESDFRWEGENKVA